MTIRIAIIGGGLGGLAAALFLRRAKLEVTVYEQAPDLHETGAGIVVPPNMVRPLKKIGLAEKLEDFAVRLEFAWEFRRWCDGTVIAVAPMDDAEALYGAPCYVALRADLRAFLYNALPKDTVCFDHRCIAVRETDDDVELLFRRASGAKASARADVVIGADGIHSLVRDVVAPKAELRFSSLCAFRCVVPAKYAPMMARRPASGGLSLGQRMARYRTCSMNSRAGTPAFTN